MSKTEIQAKQVTVQIDGRLVKRFEATCPHCDRKIIRSSRASAEHNMSMHLAYDHEDF